MVKCDFPNQDSSRTKRVTGNPPKPNRVENPLLNQLLLAGARLDSLGGGAVDVVVRDPVLVVAASGNSTSGLRAGQSGVRVGDLLDLLRGLGTLSLREESLNPGLVDKEEETREGGGQEQVEEDAK